MIRENGSITVYEGEELQSWLNDLGTRSASGRKTFATAGLGRSSGGQNFTINAMTVAVH